MEEFILFAFSFVIVSTDHEKITRRCKEWRELFEL